MDVEKTIEYILDLNSRHAAAIQQLDERMTRTEGMIRQLVDVSMSLARHGEETDRRINDLERLIGGTAQSIRELREAQAHGDRRLDALVDIVEKLTRRNGGPS